MNEPRGKKLFLRSNSPQLFTQSLLSSLRDTDRPVDSDPLIFFLLMMANNLITSYKWPRRSLKAICKRSQHLFDARDREGLTITFKKTWQKSECNLSPSASIWTSLKTPYVSRISKARLSEEKSKEKVINYLRLEKRRMERCCLKVQTCRCLWINSRDVCTILWLLATHCFLIIKRKTLTM